MPSTLVVNMCYVVVGLILTRNARRKSDTYILEFICFSRKSSFVNIYLDICISVQTL